MKLLKSHHIGKQPAMPEAEIVLRQINGEYVTHFHNIDLDGYSLGHYFGDNLEAAEKDFNDRIQLYTRS